MSYCPKCGSEVEPGSAFCGTCGAPAAGAAESAGAPAAPSQPAAPQAPQTSVPPPPPSYGPPAPPAMAAPPPPTYGPPGTPASAPYPTPAVSGGGGGKAVLLALLGLLVVGGIVVLLLGFAVGPKWFTGGGMTEQEKVADNFFKAMERKDAKLLISTVAPSSLKEMKQLLDYGYYDNLEEMFEELFFSEYESMKFEGVEYQTTVNGDKATVKVVKGKLTMVDNDGKKETKDVRDADVPVDIPLIKEDGKWYIDFENM